MEDSATLKAFYATLAAICYLATVAAILAFNAKYAEALGFGGLTTGLIGVIKLPSSRVVTVDNPPSNPVPVEPSKDGV
jgi:hypothetical protein